MNPINLRRIRLLGCMLLQAGTSSAIVTAAPSADASDYLEAVTAPGADSTKRDAAVARAREALRAAGVESSTLNVAAAEPVTWPDSSLGCRQAGIQYLQVITSGYRIELRGAKDKYVVHVAGDRSVICSDNSKLKRPLVPLRGIDAMTQRARQMLAPVVHAPVEQVRVVGFEPQVWPDTGLGCPSSQAVPGRVSGFKIMLEHAGRVYSFNTDLHRVIACPAIESE